jgi:hypothetical protein
MSHHLKKIVLLILVGISISLPTEAKIFRNAYVSFELPDRWDCHLEGTEWVCSSQLKDNSREAIIILTAKEVGPSDTFEAYEQHLKTPRAVPGSRGRPSTSQVKNVKRSQISNHLWIDAMHFGSEIPSYYTRYLASIKDRLAILVTFSAHQRYYTKYSQDFFRAIQSLKVVASKDLFKVTPLAQGQSGTEVMGPLGGGIIEPSDATVEDYPDEPSRHRGASKKILALAVLVAAVGAFLYWKQRDS